MLVHTALSLYTLPEINPYVSISELIPIEIIKEGSRGKEEELNEY